MDERNGMLTLNWIDTSVGRFLIVADPVSRHEHAWHFLKGVRRLGERDPFCMANGITPPTIVGAPSDVNLADAEHYLYARFLAGSTGDPSARALVLGYGTMKAIKYALGKDEDLRTDPRFPSLPPSVDSIDWGLKGIDDGLEDYRKTHGGKNGKLGSALRANADLIKKISYS